METVLIEVGTTFVTAVIAMATYRAGVDCQRS